MNTPKWIPKHNVDTIKLFDQTRQLERDLRVLGKKFATDINLDLPDYYEFEEILNQSRRCFEMSNLFQSHLLRLTVTSADKNFERSSYKILQSRKAILIRQNLKKRQFQLIFIIHKMIKLMMGVSLNTDIALLLCALYNEATQNVLRNSKVAGGAQVCSNTFPSLMLQPKKIDIGMILQTIAKQRSEQCCLALISCLLATCRTELLAPNTDSDTSSVEILKALTFHLTSPLLTPRLSTPDHRIKSASSQLLYLAADKTAGTSDSEDPAIKFFDNMANDFTPSMADQLMPYPNNDMDGMELLERLIADEENYLANVMLKCIKLCPSAFDSPVSKTELMKWINRGSRSLWTQVGGTLEHVVLWWSHAPLACQPSNHTKYLRDWLLIIQPEDAPEPILSTLKGLGETLTMYVTTTTWDKQFRLALVSSTLPVDASFENTDFHCATTEVSGTVSGRLWSELLYTLTNFSNSCDRQGTIPNELPIVEQIPILHRLDHSIHSMRLWAAEKAKYLCADWNMKMFFKVVHNDISQCLEQLNELRVPQLVPTDVLEVHIQVCVALRAKLVSEIKVNIQKLKLTAAQCINVLASVCKTTSLATLSLCFPSAKVWQTEKLQEKANDYVSYFLDEIYLPVLEATKDIEILGLILKIICEAWLDHIYSKKVKFSRCGAFNLLKDFDGVSEWIKACSSVPPEHSEALAKHEVLRMCEGVGRILLRKPDEVISMVPSPRYIKNENDEMDEKAPLPPEMFVPNQQRWLELRAKNRRAFNFFCLCSDIGTYN